MAQSDSFDQFREDLIKLIPKLRAFAFSLTQNSHLADDILQDSLVKALTSADHFQQGTNLRAWLLTIVRNTFYNHLRYGKSRPSSNIDDVPEHEFEIEEDQQKYLEFKDVLAGLTWLSPEHREVIILIGAEGLSYEEAASICGCPVGTVKSRLNRARQQLQELVEGTSTGTRRRKSHAISQELSK